MIFTRPPQIIFEAAFFCFWCYNQKIADRPYAFGGDPNEDHNGGQQQP